MRMFLPLTFETNEAEKKWETVEIDDFLPCKTPARKGVLSSAQPWFTGIANGNKLYVCAFADSLRGRGLQSFIQGLTVHEF